MYIWYSVISVHIIFVTVSVVILVAAPIANPTCVWSHRLNFRVGIIHMYKWVANLKVEWPHSVTLTSLTEVTESHDRSKLRRSRYRVKRANSSIYGIVYPFMKFTARSMYRSAGADGGVFPHVVCKCRTEEIQANSFRHYHRCNIQLNLINLPSNGALITNWF